MSWDLFFGNPIISYYLEESEVTPENEQEQTSLEDERKISDDQAKQLAADLQQGHLTQDDIINQFKAGKLSRADIKTILDIIKNEGAAPEEGVDSDEQPVDEEELLAQQIEQTNDLFIKFALYDKIAELTDKLNFFKENFDDIHSDLYQKVLQLSEFLNILSNLVFSVETSVVYQMYGSILLQLTELFQKYNQEIQQELTSQDNLAATDSEKWAE